MYAIPPKKMLILNILEILKRYSDENHRLSQKEIMDILERDYSMFVDRKAVKRNLMNLIEFGYDLEYTETVRENKNGEETIYSDWYLNRDFTDAELRLLIDGLLFSKSIPKKQCKALIGKLESLSNTYFKAKIKHISTLTEKISENKEVFLTIEILDEAISAGKKVTFYYNEYGADKRLHLRNDESGNPIEYEVCPYQMATTNGRYYLICNDKEFDYVSNYRVDRISNIQILDEHVIPMKKIKGLENGLDLPKHVAEHIYMLPGECVPVKFRAKRYLADDILDWFSRDVAFTEITDEDMVVSVRVNQKAMFYWSMQYGEHIEVLAPSELRNKVRNVAKAIYVKYL